MLRSGLLDWFRISPPLYHEMKTSRSFFTEQNTEQVSSIFCDCLNEPERDLFFQKTFLFSVNKIKIIFQKLEAVGVTFLICYIMDLVVFSWTCHWFSSVTCLFCSVFPPLFSCHCNLFNLLRCSSLWPLFVLQLSCCCVIFHLSGTVCVLHSCLTVWHSVDFIQTLFNFHHCLHPCNICDSRVSVPLLL